MRWPSRNDRPVDESRPLHDRYVVGAPIGQGRSTVYRGTDTRLGRAVAIKRVPLASDHESGERVRTRALREARAAAKLDNPAVVTVFDVVEEDGALWLVMELVDSPSLAQLVVDGGPLDHAHAARIGLDILSAIDTAHRVGVIHRDVKPANVLVPSEGHAKLADFGVATMRDESRLTATGMVLGSPAYMAPEQARGEEIGPPADLWALGATLYFMYEGVPPFDGGTALATASAVVHGEPRAEEQSGALTPLVARLLSKSPGSRPDADEVKAELRAIARSAEDDVHPRTAPTVAVPVAIPDSPVAEAEPAVEAAPEPEPDEVAAEDGDELEMPETLGATAGLADDPLAADAAMLAAAPGPSGDDDSEDHEPTKVVAEVPATKAAPVVPALVESESESESGLASSPTATPAHERRNVSGSMIAALVAAAVLAVAAFVVLRPDGDSGSPRDDEAEQAEPSTTADPSAAAEDPAADETTTTTEPATTTAPTTTEPAADGAVPDGWQTYTNEQVGYTIAYPPGWNVEPADGPRVDIRDNESGSYLRIDWTDQPREDPVADWQTQSQGFASNHDAYEEIDIAPYVYRDYLAAGWEFRYTDGGARLHTMNLGFVTGGRGYALYFQTKDERWDASQDTFTQFRDSFQPAP